jgi:endoglucanase
MLAAHMDEVGIMITHVDKEGFAKFIKVGGIDDSALLNQRVLFLTGNGKKNVTGIIGSKPPHLMRDEEKKKKVEKEQMAIDFGFRNDQEAMKYGIQLGAVGVFDQKCTLSFNGKCAFGKAFDDRVGCLVLLEIMRRLKNFKGTVYAVATAQEEVGLKGARVSAFMIEPDIALAFDTCPARGSAEKKHEAPAEIGKGPAISMLEAGGRGLIIHPKVLRWLSETAKREKIAHQFEAMERGMTDAAIMQLIKTGSCAGAISIPVRYIHSSVGLVSLQDIEDSAKLAVAAIKNIHRYF